MVIKVCVKYEVVQRGTHGAAVIIRSARIVAPRYSLKQLLKI